MRSTHCILTGAPISLLIGGCLPGPPHGPIGYPNPTHFIGQTPDAAAAGELTGPSARLTRLRAALAVIEAEEAAAAKVAHAQAEAARDAARKGRKLRGRKPTDPAAALARAQADHQAALTRVQAKQAERAAKIAAARAAGRAIGGFAPGPDRALARAEAALSAAHERAAAQAAEGTPTAVAEVNVTDPDSRIMKTPTGWVQGYNAQAIANQHQVVLACDVSQHAGDVLLYEPMMTRLADTLTAVGITAPVGLALADAGYWSEANATAPGPERLIATIKDHKQRRAARESATPPARRPPTPHRSTRWSTACAPRKGPPPTPNAPTPSNRSSQTANTTARSAASAAAACRPPKASGR